MFNVRTYLTQRKTEILVLLINILTLYTYFFSQHYYKRGCPMTALYAETCSTLLTIDTMCTFKLWSTIFSFPCVEEYSFIIRIRQRSKKFWRENSVIHIKCCYGVSSRKQNSLTECTVTVSLKSRDFSPHSGRYRCCIAPWWHRPLCSARINTSHDPVEQVETCKWLTLQIAKNRVLYFFYDESFFRVSSEMNK